MKVEINLIVLYCNNMAVMLQNMSSVKHDGLLVILMYFLLAGFMTSPDVPLHIGAKCGDESDVIVLLDQVVSLITCEYGDDYTLGGIIATKHSYSACKH